MAVQQAQKYCQTCKEYKLFQKETFSDGIGCLITILTGGLFIPVWLLIGVLQAFKPIRCQTCGRAWGSLSVKEQPGTEKEQQKGSKVQQDQGRSKKQSEVAGKMKEVGQQGLSAAAGTAVTAGKGTLREADGILNKMAGGDVFVQWIFRALVIGIPLLVLIIAYPVG